MQVLERATIMPVMRQDGKTVMQPDDKICYCYDVSLRKLWNFARQRRLARASQMCECLGAGTGCGWCIPMLKRVHTAVLSQQTADGLIDMTPDEYADQRRQYISEGKARNAF